MLSNRVIHFGHYEVFFDCRSGARFECDGTGYYGSSNAAPVVQMKVEHSRALAGLNVDEEIEDVAESSYQRAQLWRTIVATSTSLHLTKSKDRPPAIGGLARDMASIRKSKYLAGVWEDTVNDDLLWSVTVVTSKKPWQTPPTALSWSWASVGHFIRYWDEILFTNMEDENFRPERSPYEHFATIDSVHVTPAAVDEFGFVANVEIRLAGLVAHGTLEHEYELCNDTQQLASYFVCDCIKLPVRMDYFVDDGRPGFESQPSEVLCRRMSRVVEASTDHLISLVL